MYHTYILISTSVKRYYYGHTINLNQRLRSHNAGKVRSTKAFRPWTIHYFESFNSKSEAFKRELFFKSTQGKAWLKSKSII